jgi:hypothetical protein
MLNLPFPESFFLSTSPTLRTPSVDNMRPPQSPTRSSSQSDWVVVPKTEFGTGVHTKLRSPQLNGDNMSSSQVANATSNDASILYLSEDNHSTTHASPSAVDITTPHKPPSNGSSTETAGTDDTTLPGTLARDAQTGVLFTYAERTPTGIPLTTSNMELHQRALHQYFTGSIPGWVAGAGMGDRLLIGSGSYDSVLAVQHHMSSAASGSAVAQDWLNVPPPMPADDQVAAAGAWCDEASGLFGRRASMSVDGE